MLNVGLALGLIGVLFMPLLGAAVGEFLARRDQHRALKVGFATWLGLLAGMLAKVVLAFTMVGVWLRRLARIDAAKASCPGWPEFGKPGANKCLLGSREIPLLYEAAAGG